MSIYLLTYRRLLLLVDISVQHRLDLLQTRRVVLHCAHLRRHSPFQLIDMFLCFDELVRKLGNCLLGGLACNNEEGGVSLRSLCTIHALTTPENAARP